MTIMALPCLILATLVGVTISFSLSTDCIQTQTASAPKLEFACFAKNHETDDDEDIQPYGNRTLAWTKRYRNLVPYEAARLTAMRLGLRSQEEWDDIRQFGKAFHGAHSVSRPDIMYAKEWISWDEFLGVMRPYEEAKQMIQEELKLSGREEYMNFVESDTQQAQLLRIPAEPEIYYRRKGWESDEAFFGIKEA